MSGDGARQEAAEHAYPLDAFGPTQTAEFRAAFVQGWDARAAQPVGAQPVVETDDLDAMRRIMGWQHLVRYAGMSREWMEATLGALATAARRSQPAPRTEGDRCACGNLLRSCVRHAPFDSTSDGETLPWSGR